RLAEIFANFELFDESLAAVDDGLKLAGPGPDGFALVGVRANVLVHQEKYEPAAVALDDLEKRAAEMAQQRDVMSRRVDLYRRAGTVAQEIDKLVARLKSDSSRSPAELALGYDLLALLNQAGARSAEAIAAVEKALELDATAPERLALAADL